MVLILHVCLGLVCLGVFVAAPIFLVLALGFPSRTHTERWVFGVIIVSLFFVAVFVLDFIGRAVWS